MDTPEAAAPHIRQAKPTYPALIDRDHHVSALFNMVNVPEAVWIDEQGRIVRPAENAGSFDAFRVRDRVTGAMPADATAASVSARQIYTDAVRDWVANGAGSRFALDAQRARQEWRRPTENVALAQAHFRLGRHLARTGKDDEATRHFEKAQALHPDSWNMWRQTAAKNEVGFAAGPDFWARVDALGERRYRDRANIEGMP